MWPIPINEIIFAYRHSIYTDSYTEYTCEEPKDMEWNDKTFFQSNYRFPSCLLNSSPNSFGIRWCWCLIKCFIYYSLNNSFSSSTTATQQPQQHILYHSPLPISGQMSCRCPQFEQSENIFNYIMRRTWLLSHIIYYDYLIIFLVDDTLHHNK